MYIMYLIIDIWILKKLP